MLFHLTSDDHIRIINEQGAAETDTAGRTLQASRSCTSLLGNGR